MVKAQNLDSELFSELSDDLSGDLAGDLAGSLAMAWFPLGPRLGPPFWTFQR